MLRYAIAFLLFSALLAWLSRKTLRQPRSHGFSRFLAWECILLLTLWNWPAWHLDPWSPHQWASWALFLASAALPLHSVHMLGKFGRPSSQREDASLYDFEKTSFIVERGAFGYIRHPMYTALMLLTGAVFLKHFSWPGLALLLLSFGLLVLTTLRDEAECLAHFGEAYRAYMERTPKRFIPFVL